MRGVRERGLRLRLRRHGVGPQELKNTSGDLVFVGSGKNSTEECFIRSGCWKNCEPHDHHQVINTFCQRRISLLATKVGRLSL